MNRSRFALLTLAMIVMAGACSPSSTPSAGGLEDPGDCTVIDLAVSPEKRDLLTELSQDFNASDQARDGDRCFFARVQAKSSGAAASLLSTEWDEAVEGPRPVIWSPSASTWGGIVNQRLDSQGEPPLTGDFTSFQLTPLVIAMPKPMATALGWPNEPLGFADILALSQNPAGWGAYGHPEWGSFRLGKTNPNFSTSGLSALLAQAYAANGKTAGLSLEDLKKPSTSAFASAIESSVVHYGDTTLTFLNNWYRADQRGNPYGYVSAVAVEEKSVIDYNRGNPDGVLQDGEQARPPRVPLVAIYPEEGTVYSDNPLYVLDASWVDSAQKKGAGRFVDFLDQTDNQKKILKFGFRPGNPKVAVSSPINERNGVDPTQPQTLLGIPEPEVLVQLLDDWQDQRKPARVLLLVDVSGSMGEVADPDTGATKLDLAKTAAITALDEFNDDDQVGLWVFTTDLPGADGKPTDHLELLPPGRVGDVGEQLKSKLRALVPLDGTPLYAATQAAYESQVASYDPSRINAVVLLSDGINEDGDPEDDRGQLQSLLEAISAGSEGQASQKVRVFTIAYGSSADLSTLRDIAETSQAANYDSSDPRSINKIFVAVVSNF